MHKIRFYDTTVICIQAKSSYLACPLVVDCSKPSHPPIPENVFLYVMLEYVSYVKTVSSAKI